MALNFYNAMTKFKYIKQHVSRPLFIRGLDIVGNNLFVGLSPATIICIDYKTGKMIDAFNYSSNVLNCVHGLKADI